jgi:hypothetical protein
MDSYLQAVSLVGDAEVFLMHRKDALQSALAQLLVKKKVKTAQDLVQLYQIPGGWVCVGAHAMRLFITVDFMFESLVMLTCKASINRDGNYLASLTICVLFPLAKWREKLSFIP